MDLFLKIFVLQATFCWLGDLEEIMSLEGKSCSEIGNVGCLKGISCLEYSCHVLFARNLSSPPSPPAPPTKVVNFARWPHPISFEHPPPTTTTPKLASNVWTYVCWETSQ